jgi:hypothetical protein
MTLMSLPPSANFSARDDWDGTTPSSVVSYGPDWDAAVAYGLDMTLIEVSLAMTPGQRAERLQSLPIQMAELREAFSTATTRGASALVSEVSVGERHGRSAD